MPILRITGDITGPRLFGSHDLVLPHLRQALAADPGPVTIMIHGFRYLPGDPMHCPHNGLFATNPHKAGPRIISWPRRLGLRGQPGEGLGIAFGWNARGGIRAAYAQAAQAGSALACLLKALNREAPGRAVRLFTHSLGARVVLDALARGAPARCAVLLSAAEFDHAVKAALDVQGTSGCQILNVASRENDLFDALLQWSVPRPAPAARTLGHHEARLHGLVTLQLDCADTLNGVKALGFQIGPPERRICHWSGYLRPGVFPLYRAFMNGALPLGDIRACVSLKTTPRWSLLMPGFRGRKEIAQLPVMGPTNTR